MEPLFQGVFMHQKELERIVVTGCAIHYDKTGCFSSPTRKVSQVLESGRIICAMANSVTGKKEEKLVKWETKEGRLTLEVINRRAVTKAEQNAIVAILETGNVLPPYGLSTLIEYESVAWDGNINPIAVE